LTKIHSAKIIFSVLRALASAGAMLVISGLRQPAGRDSKRLISKARVQISVMRKREIVDFCTKAVCAYLTNC